MYDLQQSVTTWKQNSFLTRDNLYVAPPPRDEWQCDTCKGAGIVSTQSGATLLCHCSIRYANQVLADEWKAVSHQIGKKYHGLTWEDFAVEDGQYRKNNESTLKAIQDWVRDPNNNVYLNGPVSTGKTMLATIAYRQLWRLGTPAIWFGVMPLVEQIKKEWRDRTGEFDRIVTQAQTVPVLFLDDIGEGGLENSDAVQSTLKLVIDRRVSEVRPTFTTSNLTPQDLMSKNPRLAARLLEDLNGTKVARTLVSTDMRQHKLSL